MNKPILEKCDSGHSFYKLPDHPKNSIGHSSCPYCLAIGEEVLKAEIEALKEALRMKVILNTHVEKAMRETK